MLNEIEQLLPPQWRGVFKVATVPLAWLGPFQSGLFSLVWSTNPMWAIPFKRFFLLLPVICTVVGLWCSMISLYSLVFRPYRVKFITSILILWWDAVRAVWLFWAGMLRFFILIFGT